MSESRVPGTGRLLLAAVVLSGIVGGIAGGLIGWAVARSGNGSSSGSNQPVAAGGSSASVAQTAASARPSVVTVMTQPTAATALAAGATFASGFVATSDGLVVTSSHAVAGATRLRVATADGHLYDAVVAASDPLHGVALLRLTNAHGLGAVAFASSAPRPGDLAVAVGSSPAGADVGVGTIHATGAPLHTADLNVAGAVLADVAVSAQDDGAPLLNGSGQVVGVVIATPASSSSTVAASGLDAQRLVTAVNGGSSSNAASFGIVTEQLDPAAAALAGVPAGALVVAVVPGSGAGAVVAPGDVVTAVNGTGLDASRPLSPQAFGLSAGTTATLTVVSGGLSRSVTVTVGQQ